jgi:hypothetical protein
MWNILPKLNATHAFINLGWEWITTFDDISELSCSIREFERHHPSIRSILLLVHQAGPIYLLIIHGI